MKIKHKSIFGIVVGVAGILAAVIAILDYVEQRNMNKEIVNLTGEWVITNIIETTSFRPYQNLKLEYRIFLKQNEKNVSGRGEKCKENGRELPSQAHTPIYIDGIIDGKKLTATFNEEGARRTTAGYFVWNISQNGKNLEGNFTSTAADTRGSSRGKFIK